MTNSHLNTFLWFPSNVMKDSATALLCWAVFTKVPLTEHHTKMFKKLSNTTK